MSDERCQSVLNDIDIEIAIIVEKPKGPFASIEEKLDAYRKQAESLAFRLKESELLKGHLVGIREHDHRVCSVCGNEWKTEVEDDPGPHIGVPLAVTCVSCGSVFDYV